MWNIFFKILNFGWKHFNLILQFLLQKRGNSRASSAVVKDSLSSHRERYSIMADARPSTTHAMRVGIEIRPRFSVVWVLTHHFLPTPPNIKEGICYLSINMYCMMADPRPTRFLRVCDQQDYHVVFNSWQQQYSQRL